ncbi:replication endonuclease [Paraburkholderia saeva]|uniref:replication endonuclease n=1 Tax=Paraburkholderia saeva TaxID=2777537 RepID=UPI001E32ADC9|nr:replication endonuclease [Paraburkholderia saeva]
MVAEIPRPWAARLLSAWEKRRASFNPLVTTGEGIARRKANEQLRADVALMRPVSDVLPLDASDTDLCNAAWNMAEKCRVKLLTIEAEQEHVRTADFLCAVHAAGVVASATAIDAFEQRTALARICIAGGIAAPEETRYEDLPAVRRMVAAHWWKGRLRKAHGKARETAAINLGVVRRDRECYVSDVSKLDRQWQNERNAAALAATIAKNLETEQEFTLAELAAKGPANAAIKRAELMTRINGFERIAIAAAHTGLFLTITCPSKMHRMKTQGSRVVENGKWDGTTPDEAQRYLAKVWARIRAALARGTKKHPPVSLYGFRIAEPQHDGTPHWHCLFFYPQEDDAHVRATVRRYALEMDGNEPGAQEKRCDFKTMDPAKGTAAGYIAKYIAKNIDGYRLEKDLEGNDALETSARVEAWATRWRIRQFQQIGGPPVTVWRELRRVESVPADSPAHVRKAHAAVNRVALLEGRENASVAWDHYVEAQGGIACGRGYRVRIAKIPGEAVGRYGETGAPQIVGIEYFEVAKVRDAVGNWIDVLPRTVTVESKRFTWEIMRPAASARAGYAARPVTGLDLGLKRAQRAPWTCVNNCTGEGENGRYREVERDGGRGAEGDRRALDHGENRRREASRADARNDQPYPGAVT